MFSSNQNWKIALIILALFTSLTVQTQSENETVFFEDWEGDWTTNWHVDAGTWEVGIPTSGPDSAYAGQNCAATVLAGDFPNNASTRLIRHTSFTVPAADQNPRLRFWHWYSMSNDAGSVQIKVGSGEWQTISETYINTGGGIWTYALIDLSAFADSMVQIGFYFGSGSAYQSSGWYIDNVAVISGPMVFDNPETWEMGLGDWHGDRGTWEVGVPTSGPGSAYAGQNCAATVLAGNFPNSASTRLISPSFIVPGVSVNPSLTFWHWYSMSNDAGSVQIKVGSGEWQTILGPYINTSGNIWTYVYFDLSPFADSTVQIGFYFGSGSAYQSSGWYIDEIFVTGLTGIYDLESFTESIILHQNTPNPFTNMTKINYKIASNENIHLGIYTLNGKLVKTLIDKKQNKGDYSITWNGTNDFNQKVRPGIYYYSLKTNKKSVTKKMILIR